MSIKIAPSILAADFGNLSRDCEIVDKSVADWFHLDVMDGVFVPNISFGQPIVKTLSLISNKPLDVHLMIVDPKTKKPSRVGFKLDKKGNKVRFAKKSGEVI